MVMHLDHVTELDAYIGRLFFPVYLTMETRHGAEVSYALNDVILLCTCSLLSAWYMLGFDQ